jgi:O-antigen ligase
MKLKYSNLADNLSYFFILFLIVGYSLYPKDFSKLDIGFSGITIYITEIIIGAVFVLLYLKIIFNNGKLILKTPLKLEFALFYFIFLISLFTGLFLYNDFTFVLRQSALFYYSILYFLVILVLNDIDNLLKLKFIFLLLFIFINIITLYLFLNFFHVNILDAIGFRYLGLAGERYFYIALLLVLEVVYLTFMKRSIFSVILIISIIMLLFVTFTLGVRGNWISVLAAVLFAWIFLGTTPGLKRELRNFNLLILSFIVIIIIIGLLVYFKKIGIDSDFFKQVKGEILSLFNIYTRDNTTPTVNTTWRLITWKEMFSEIKDRPILGFGFGKKFISKETLNLGWTTGIDVGWVEAHNIFLSFLYKTGFLGLGSFLIIIVSFFRKVVRFLRVCMEENIKIIVIGLSCCIIYILALGVFDVVLEVPYFGSILWIIMGLIIVIMNYYERKYKREPIKPQLMISKELNDNIE